MSPALARPDSTDVVLPEPAASLLALLSDLDEQVEIAGRQIGADPLAKEILSSLRFRLAALGLVVTLAGRH